MQSEGQGSGEEPLHVYGPIDLQVITDHILSAYAEDIQEHL